MGRKFSAHQTPLFFSMKVTLTVAIVVAGGQWGAESFVLWKWAEESVSIRWPWSGGGSGWRLTIYNIGPRVEKCVCSANTAALSRPPLYFNSLHCSNPGLWIVLMTVLARCPWFWTANLSNGLFDASFRSPEFSVVYYSFIKEFLEFSFFSQEQKRLDISFSAWTWRQFSSTLTVVSKCVRKT